MRTVSLALFATSVAGCAFFAPLPKKIWVEQYNGLAQLPDANTRLNALATVTESAAADGDAAAVKRFLKDFRGDPRHDDLAARCALQLVGKSSSDAEDIAELIDDPSRREETLAKLRPKPEAKEPPEGDSKNVPPPK